MLPSNSLLLRVLALTASATLAVLSTSCGSSTGLSSGPSSPLFASRPPCPDASISAKAQNVAKNLLVAAEYGVPLANAVPKRRYTSSELAQSLSEGGDLNLWLERAMEQVGGDAQYRYDVQRELYAAASDARLPSCAGTPLYSPAAASPAPTASPPPPGRCRALLEALDVLSAAFNGSKPGRSEERLAAMDDLEAINVIPEGAKYTELGRAQLQLKNDLAYLKVQYLSEGAPPRFLHSGALLHNAHAVRTNCR